MLLKHSLVQSVWRLDPSVPNPTWQYVTGSNATGGSTASQPAARYWHSCDAAANTGAYCANGGMFCSK